MYGVVVNRGAWHAIGQRLGGFLIWVNKAYSQGWVRARSAHPDIEPRVELNLLSDERDQVRLEDALARMAGIFRHPTVARAAHSPFSTSYTERSRDLAVVTMRNRLRTEPVGRLLELPEPARRRMMQWRVSGGLSLFELVRDEEALRNFVRDRAHGTWHCCGTARMGREEDPVAATDPEGRVYGVEGLRVADASLMPSVPRANTNLPTIMIGEKIADAMVRGWAG
jgi:5-(hydroxymethyl)furfural/furfural oxidase